MERKESKSRRSEFCPSCSRVMMSYVNTMQDFLDKVVEEIECNTPPRRDTVPARTLIRDISDVRRLPLRRGQTSRAESTLTETTELKSETKNVVREGSNDLPKSQHLIKAKQIPDHTREQVKPPYSFESPIKHTHKQEYAEISRSDSHVQNQFRPSEAYKSSPELQNKQNEYDIPSPSIDQKYEINFQSHIPSEKYQNEIKTPDLDNTLPVANSQSSEILQQSDEITNLMQNIKGTEQGIRYSPTTEHQKQHQEESTDNQIYSVEDRHAHTSDDGSRYPSSVKEMPHFEPSSPEGPHIELPSPEVPLPPTWVENMLNICDIPLIIPPEYEREAYVTMATNNLTAIGAMVLGNSLRLSNTSRTLAVLIADEVTDELRNVLASVFHVVQRISSLEPMGSTKLALLEQPELGITYSKLLVWRLTLFDKCVFLSPDTLVIQNCDELFERNEISAVPDIGWPDCFNTAVFVFTPSDETFWNLVSFAETKGSFDGGDQGLLNMYFRTWSLDLHKRLPFIYNLMANVSYTYGPAFVKFGGNAKVVHFFGTTKPWNVQFNVVTGQLAPFSGVHPTFSSYVQYWLTIFARCVLPLFSQDVQEYSTSNNYVNALDLARIVAGSNDAVFSFSPPSFRRYLDSSEPISFPSEKVQNTVLVGVKEEEESSSESEEELPTIEKSEEETKDESLNDYNRMLAWEQGRMDYLGHDSSDNVLKRLDHAIRKGDRSS
ncbi:glycogenin-2-like [Centruroides vittatus]|uniref:glycogenin-2-like n=1 Tax=Centruroides vittatus TaxID=120091 RepID=UPI003510D06D